MRTDSFLSVKVVTSTREFDKKIESPDFYDALPLGKTSAVMIEDGIVVQNTNVISISSKIYSVSKVSFLGLTNIQPRLTFFGKLATYFIPAFAMEDIFLPYWCFWDVRKLEE